MNSVLVLFFCELFLYDLSTVHVAPSRILKLLLLTSLQSESAVPSLQHFVLGQIYATIWLFENQPLIEDVVGADVINKAQPVLLFGGSNLRAEVDEFIRAGLFSVGAEGGRVENVDNLGQSEGQPIFEGVNAFGHA